MALEYFNLYSNTLDYIEPLTMEERGQLLTAICEYAFDGVLPKIEGNARFIFPVFKTAIERSIEKANDISMKRSEAGKNGGRPKKQQENIETKESKCFSEENKKTNCFSKKPNENKKSYKDIDKDIDIDKDKELSSYSFEADEELIQKQEEQNQVLDAAYRCGMGNNESERFKLIDLYTQYGAEKVIAGLDECVTHGATTIAYLKAVLENKPKKEKHTGKVLNAQKFSQRDWSADTDDMDAMMAGRG